MFMVTGDQFVANVIAATRSLLRSLWYQPKHWTDIKQIDECVRHIHQLSDTLVDLDPIPFIHIISRLLRTVIPLRTLQKHQESICELMDELAELLPNDDPIPKMYAYRQCVSSTIRHFEDIQMGKERLVSLLKGLSLEG